MRVYKQVVYFGLPGYCVYKNKMYRQSERWVDGCDYNCICEDASTGFWRCADM